MRFYNVEDWAANNLQNQEISRKSPLGHRGGADQGGSDRMTTLSMNSHFVIQQATIAVVNEIQRTDIGGQTQQHTSVNLSDNQ